MSLATAWVTQHGKILGVVMLALGAANASLAQLACEVAHVNASDGGSFDSFGDAVGLSGNTALMGAFWDGDNGNMSGSAYVFRFDGTTWVQAQKLLASDGQSGDWFGRTVAIEGDTAMVAALFHIHGDVTGSVYVFRNDGLGWIQQQELLASDRAAGDGFGFSVAIDGHTAVIGAPADDDDGFSSGSAYVFRYNPKTLQWIEEQKLTASDAAAGDNFGVSVAVDRNTAAIGAFGDDDNGVSSGSAYVFRFDGLSWVEETKLLASDGTASDHFGSSASISGDAALIGARDADHNGVSSGTAYVFRRDPVASAWVQEQELVPSDAQGGDLFGISVALDGDTALVGAEFVDEVGSDYGAAYVFRFNGGSWIEQQKLLPDPGLWTAFFGRSVALDGDTAVVGAHGEATQSGSAYVFAGLSGIDCNSTGRSDACDIFFGQSDDANGNGIPDECECPWDLDGGGTVGITDFLALLAAWGPNPGDPADFDGDGVVGIVDFLLLLANWGPCQ